MQSRIHRAPADGFTLIELVITVAIVGILAAVSLPSYLESVTRGRRADARAVLAEATQYMQRFYLANDRYDQDVSGIAVALPSTVSRSPKNGAAYYTISLAPGLVTRTTFVVQATPVKADACGTYRLNEKGQQTLVGNTKPDTYCWR